MNIHEMDFDGTKEYLKKTIQNLYEMMFIGYNGKYEIKTAYDDYDTSLEGKARKQSSKEINVLTEQLWAVTNYSI